MYYKKKYKKYKKFLRKNLLGTLEKNDVIEKLLISSDFFFTNFFTKPWCTYVTSFKADT